MASVPTFMQGKGGGPHSFFFDFDGTLYPGESLEEVLSLALVDVADRGAKVAALEDLGRRGMEGSLPFETSLRGRLDIIQPHRRHIDEWVARAQGRLNPIWLALLEDLRSLDHSVRVVSGGFRDCIEPVAGALGIESHEVHCNAFRYGSDGWVVGLDEDQPLSRTGGKPLTVRELVASGGVPGVRIVVGDGVTDLEAVAEGACNGMFGLGAYAVRPAVRDNADVFFNTVEDLDHFVRAQFL